MFFVDFTRISLRSLRTGLNSDANSNLEIQIIVLIGYTCAGIQVAALPAIVSTYAVDSYKPVAGSIFVTITVNKNLWGYGFSEFITKWIEADGFVKPIMLNTGLTVLWCLCAVPFYVWGKRVRRWTAKSSVHDM
jgi:hypothetical protein